MTQESKPDEEFTYFPLLPTEIRLRIWKLSIPYTSRLLPSPPVAGLLLNHESREVYLKAYTPCFQTDIKRKMKPTPFPLSTNANFAHDMLFFGEFSENCAWHKYEIWNQPFAEYLVKGALEQIEHLAVRYIDYHFSGLQDTRDRLFELKALKTLTIAVDDTDYRKWDGEEHWSNYQQIDWDAPLLEYEVKKSDGQWEYMNGIQRFLLGLEMQYGGYKAPELKFARINYTYGGLKDSWVGVGGGYDQIQAYCEEENVEKEVVAQWRMACSESYNRCCLPSW
jgi:2EXR family